MVVLSSAILFSFAVLAHAATQQSLGNTTGVQDTCELIAAAISSASAVFYPRKSCSSLGLLVPVLTNLTCIKPPLTSLGGIYRRHRALGRVEYHAVCV
jgi:hypothetical protein